MEHDVKNLLSCPSWCAILVFITVEPSNSYIRWAFSPGSHSRSDSPWFRKYAPSFPYRLQREPQAGSLSFQARGKWLFSNLIHIWLDWTGGVLSREKKILSPFISATFRFYFTFHLIILVTIDPLRKTLLELIISCRCWGECPPLHIPERWGKFSLHGLGMELILNSRITYLMPSPNHYCQNGSPNTLRNRSRDTSMLYLL